jgi:hypothetical protein
MTRSLIFGATALALSVGAASAQTLYVEPGYGPPAYTAPAPVIVAPAPIYMAPSVVVPRYYAPRAAVTVSTPVYNYAAPFGPVDDWDW